MSAEPWFWWWCSDPIDSAIVPILFIGRNNGTIQSRQYFTCPENHGIFVRPSCVTLLKKPRRQTILQRTSAHTEKKKKREAERYAERMLRLQKIDYTKRMAMRAKGLTIRESLGVRHLCTPTRPKMHHNLREARARPRSDRRVNTNKILFPDKPKADCTALVEKKVCSCLLISFCTFARSLLRNHEMH